MNILAIGDIHIQLKNLDEIDLFLKKLVLHLSENTYDLIVCMGDVLNDHQDLDTMCLKKAHEYFKILSQYSKYPAQILVGNHDYISNMQNCNDNHWMSVYHESKLNIEIVDDVKVREYKTKNGDYKLCFCPYIPDGLFMTTLEEKLEEKKIDINEIKLIFGHQVIDGVKMGPIVAKGVEDVSILKEKGIHLYMGHIHDKQEIDGYIHYIGACMQHGFAESSKKTVLRIEMRDNEIIHKKINLNPVSKKIIYTDVAKIPKYLKKIKDKLESGKFKVRFSIGDTPDRYSEFKRSDVYRNAVKMGVKFEYKNSTQRKRKGEEDVSVEKDERKEEKNIKAKQLVRVDFFNLLSQRIESDKELYKEYERVIKL